MHRKLPRKAIGPIVATLLLVAIAVSLSVVAFMWGQAFLSNSQRAASSTDKSSSVTSAITIESATLDNNSRTVILTVRNLGDSNTTLRNVVVQNLVSGAGEDVLARCDLGKGAACVISVGFSPGFHFRDDFVITAYTIQGASTATRVFVDV